MFKSEFGVCVCLERQVASAFYVMRILEGSAVFTFREIKTCDLQTLPRLLLRIRARQKREADIDFIAGRLFCFILSDCRIFIFLSNGHLCSVATFVSCF